MMKPKRPMKLVSLLKLNQHDTDPTPSSDGVVQTAVEPEQITPDVEQITGSAAQNAAPDSAQILKRMKSNVTRQIILAALTVVLVATLIFAMSLSWYTNVSKTSDLQLQTEAWGFDAKNIQLADSTATLAPGKTVIVPLIVDNSAGTSAVNALVTVDKSGTVKTDETTEDAGVQAVSEETADTEKTLDMATELPKRLYFYVDKSQTYTFTDENDTKYDETVSRIYLGSDLKTESYSYSLMAGEKLTMSEEFCSDAPLYCEWVTDLEGYYFKGTVKETTSDGGASTYTVTEDEYLRPVTYTMADAVFEDNALAKIGDVTVAAYVQSLTQNDGYEGSFTLTDENKIDSKYCVTVPAASHTVTVKDADGKETTAACDHTYYKIDVDEKTGEGIWLYLYCEAEVEAATAFDSELNLALEQNQKLFTVAPAVKVTASAVEQTETKISTFEDLKNAVGQNTSAVLVLQNDITLKEPITLSSGTTLQLNLNKYAIDFAATGTAFTVPEGAKLILLNGTLAGNGKDSGTDGSAESKSGVLCTGGEVILGNVTITNMDTAVMMDDSAATLDSCVKLTGCTLDTSGTSVILLGNGKTSTALSRMIVQDCTIKSGYIGISGQSTDSAKEHWGTELILAGGTVTGRVAGIFLPQQQSTAILTGCTATGYTGVVVKGGTVTVYKSTITGTAKTETEGAVTSGDAFENTGDGIYVEATNEWRATVVLRGNENNVTGDPYAVELKGDDGKGPGTITIEGGTISGSKDRIYTNGIGTLNEPETETKESAASAEQ